MNLIFTALWLIGMTAGCASLGVHFGDQTMHLLWGFIGGFFGFLIAMLIRFGIGSSEGWDGLTVFDGFSSDSSCSSDSSSSSSCD